MADAITMSAPISGTDRKLTLETGKLAGQADGAVVARLGDTVVLVTATAAKTVREGIDFFPLTVDIEERMYAAGKIPGSFFRREGRATDQAILTGRLIDRPLRPSFPAGFRNEVHVVGTILGADQENPHDVLAINAASAALMVSGIPFDGPIGAVRVAWTQDGSWTPHATYQEGDESTFELVVAGRARGEESDADIAIMMVEAGGTENAWSYYESGAPKVTEEVIAAGLEAAKTWIRESIELQRRLVAEAGAKPPIPYEPQLDFADDVRDRVGEVGTESLTRATSIVGKAERNAALDEAAAQIGAALEDELGGREREVKAAVRALTKQLVRRRIVEDGVRIDGRGPRDIRPLSAEVGVIPTAHGSGLFQRGETQVLNVTTLGMPRMNQLLDTIGIDESKRYMHHYNFPPFSTGETGFMRGPKRREIGHGLLAERALLPVVPSVEEFPYTLRLVSEVLSSNGSTSMASVCGSTLSLMDAGVPVKAPVAGIAMGLVHAEGRYTTLTDILGAEDAFGDMDFKVAGSADVVTALQLDTKIDGLPAEVLAEALQQAHEARQTILGVMAEAIAQPRPSVNEHAPKIVSIEIPLDKIGEVIGPKGKVINAIQQETGADINVDDDGMVGTVTIGAKDGRAVEEARRRLGLILEPPKAELGAVYPGKVVNITKFGAFVNILPGRDGLVHISKLGQGRRVERVEDVVELGQSLDVRVDDIDPQGKISLSLAGDGAGEGAGRSGAPSDTGDRASSGDAPEGRRRRDEGSGGRGRSGGGADDRGAAPDTPAAGLATAENRGRYVAFDEDAFERELESELGQLGPQGSSSTGGGSRRPEGGRGGGGAGGGGGQNRRRRGRR
ncbi:MAG: polyribonucleotide nucleotidyltransferase [Actinobacteria bacterium]|nr:MAG: polyribonucleotide nucleotidyltransferase [Actinomycetota bacterium]